MAEQEELDPYVEQYVSILEGFHFVQPKNIESRAIDAETLSERAQLGSPEDTKLSAWKKNNLHQIAGVIEGVTNVIGEIEVVDGNDVINNPEALRKILNVDFSDA